MPLHEEQIADAARRIVSDRPAELFTAFCREILMFPERVEVEFARFELRFSSGQGFNVIVSPYRDLFVVSVGEPGSCDIRVAEDEQYIRALDLTLQHFLGSVVSESCARK
jgi:hypothetical protein